MDVDVSQMRTPYGNDVFSEGELASDSDPFILFETWFKAAVEEKNIIEPQAMCLSTCSTDCKPSSRYVLMKSFNKQGFSFYTNYESRKGREIAQNPNASLLFYWQPLHRQVRIEGTVEQLSDLDSAEYFKTRPKSSQASATISLQSQIAPSRFELETKMKECLDKYASKEIPRPTNWGGYLLQPTYFEFWHGHSSRLHDRIIFEKNDSNEMWNKSRLYP